MIVVNQILLPTIEKTLNNYFEGRFLFSLSKMIMNLNFNIY
jgi:hypothetical protein